MMKQTLGPTYVHTYVPLFKIVIFIPVTNFKLRISFESADYPTFRKSQAETTIFVGAIFKFGWGSLC